MDSPRRTILKAGLWTALGWLTMTLIGWLLTGSAALGGGMALVNSALGLAMYFVYERIWARISWGRDGA